MSQFTIGQTFQAAVKHHQAGQLAQAESLYRQVLAQQPNHAQALHLLGVIAQQVGQSNAALDLMQRAIALNPGISDAWCNLGNVLKETGQPDKAIAAYHRALALNPALWAAHSNLGGVLRDQGRLDESLAACLRAIALNPGFSEAHTNLGNVHKDQGQLDEAVAAYRQAFALKPANAEAHSNLVYALHFHPAYDAQMIGEEHRRWNRQHALPLQSFIQPHPYDRSPDRRLKIGYVSPDFQGHPVGRFILPLLANHDHHHFEIFAYAQVARPDALTRQLRSHADHWRNLLALSDEHAAKLIRDDGIDILVDLTMHMAGSRLLAFARKPAPLQITYLAYCSTTGLSAIDYRFSDPYLDPSGHDPSIYSEKTIRLPETYWCYQPVSNLPISPVPALKAGHITFGSLNNFCKVSAPALAAWARILVAVPNSQLLLHAHEGSHRQRTAELLRQFGVDPARLHFAGRLPLSDYAQLHQQIDIALDPFPYGGGTTTCDALWMGVPAVTLAGKTAVGRGGLSILSNLALPQLVAHSEEDYVHIATELARDTPRLKQLRSALRDRMMQSPLMNAPRFAHHVEAAYRDIWRKWCADNA